MIKNDGKTSGSKANQDSANESWWLDYIEGELDPATRVEVKSILKHSKADQEIVSSLQETKEFIEDNSINLPDLDDAYYEQLTNKIMAKVEETEMAPPPIIVVRSRHREAAKKIAWRVATVGTAVFCVAIVASFLATANLRQKFDPVTEMAKQSAVHPEEDALFLSYQNEGDFFVDVASQSFDDLTKDEFNHLMEKTKTR